MDRQRQVSIYGVRGSAPMADQRFLAYGGNTACIGVSWCGERLALDAGSGLSALNDPGQLGGCKRLHILLSHLHLDHVMGLFDLALLRDPEAEVFLYGPAQEGGLRQALETLVAPPYWPLPLGECRAKLTVQELQPGQSFPLGELRVDTLAGCHPNGSLLYRLEGEGRSLVYTLDCELAGDMAARLADFARGCDLLIWDASFTPQDLPARRGWGHSSWEEGLALARSSGVGRVLMTHYAREYDNQRLAEQERLAGEECLFAREGMELWL